MFDLFAYLLQVMLLLKRFKSKGLGVNSKGLGVECLVCDKVAQFAPRKMVQEISGQRGGGHLESWTFVI